jgi:hypothetical protein
MHKYLVIEMDSAQLIHSIEQQLENLMHFDGDLAHDYDLLLYDDQEQPIIKNFTPQVLEQLTQIVYELDHD